MNITGNVLFRKLYRIAHPLLREDIFFKSFSIDAAIFPKIQSQRDRCFCAYSVRLFSVTFLNLICMPIVPADFCPTNHSSF